MSYRVKLNFLSVHKAILAILFGFIVIIAYAKSEHNLYDSDGRVINSNLINNKWVIVNYWAEWCDSCMEEIPELNKFYKNNHDKNMVIFGVNYDGLPRPNLQQAIRKAGILFPVLLENPSQKWRLGEVTVLPTTFIINPQGDVVKKIIGPNTEQSLLRVVHNRLLVKHTRKVKESEIG